MKSILRYALFSVALGLAVVPSVGCKVTVETETLYKGTTDIRDLNYVSGGSLTISNENGLIRVATGTGSTVHVEATPFSTAEDEKTAQNTMNSKLAVNTNVDTASGAVTVSAVKNGGPAMSGYDLVVFLPANFDGALNVTQNNGSTDITVPNGWSSAANLTIDNGSLEAFLANGILNVNKSATGDAKIEVSGAGSGSVTVSSGTPDIEFFIPTASVTQIQAYSKNGKEVLVEGGVPASWTVNAASPASKTFSCNGGTTGGYTLTLSDEDALGQITIIPQ